MTDTATPTPPATIFAHVPPGEKDTVAIYVPPGIEVQIFRSVPDILNWAVEQLGGSQSRLTQPPTSTHTSPSEPA